MNWRIVFVLLLLTPVFLFAEPNGVTIVSNETETPTPQAAATQTTAGGSFTTLVLNATTQTIKWKAYVGNVSGVVTLRDAANFTIYDWDLTTVTGEVYASRNSSIDWTSVECANQSMIDKEESELSITTTAVDSINNTFNDSVHAAFFIGTTQLSSSSCRAIATYINNTAQAASESADFQEILIADTSQRFAYTTILEEDAQGYNNDPFDFQMIVAEDPTTSTASTYYFWAELG